MALFGSMRRNKFNAKKVVYDGFTFDSIKESRRYLVLRQMQHSGVISDLQIHPRIPLMCNGVSIGTYIGDFCYKDVNGKVILEDVKSKATKTPVYNLKKKILQTMYPPIFITEVFNT